MLRFWRPDPRVTDLCEKTTDSQNAIIHLSRRVSDHIADLSIHKNADTAHNLIRCNRDRINEIEALADRVNGLEMEVRRLWAGKPQEQEAVREDYEVTDPNPDDERDPFLFRVMLPGDTPDTVGTYTHVCSIRSTTVNDGLFRFAIRELFERITFKVYQESQWLVYGQFSIKRGRDEWTFTLDCNGNWCLAEQTTFCTVCGATTKTNQCRVILEQDPKEVFPWADGSGCKELG